MLVDFTTGDKISAKETLERIKRQVVKKIPGYDKSPQKGISSIWGTFQYHSSMWLYKLILFIISSFLVTRLKAHSRVLLPSLSNTKGSWTLKRN